MFGSILPLFSRLMRHGLFITTQTPGGCASTPVIFWPFCISERLLEPDGEALLTCCFC
jgi:hypothetical protein